MSNLDVLRKQYEHLTPFERAVMVHEAAIRMDESAVDALEPPSLWDAFHMASHGRVFESIAFTAVHESQNADLMYWAAMAVIVMFERDEALFREDSSKNDAKIDECQKRMDAGKRGRLAWLRALQALDDEIGSACLVSARISAGKYVANILDRAEGEEVDHSAELSYLRELWTAGSQNSPDAPKVA